MTQSSRDSHSQQGITRSWKACEHFIVLENASTISIIEGAQFLIDCQSTIDLDEDEIFPATFAMKDVQYLYNNIVDFPLWFEGVDLPKDPFKGIEHRDGRGRLLLSPHAKQQYPNDDDAGAHWVEHGVFALGETGGTSDPALQ